MIMEVPVAGACLELLELKTWKNKLMRSCYWDVSRAALGFHSSCPLLKTSKFKSRRKHKLPKNRGPLIYTNILKSLSPVA